MPSPTRRFVFTGPMATGKSAVGRAVAARHGMTFIDTDRRITERHGPIPAIFERGGEELFRRIEADIVREVLDTDAGALVVSLGGGAVLDAGTRSLLRAECVILLDADLATVLPRIRGGSSRPMLSGDPGRRWTDLYAQRHPLYLEVADIVVDTRGRTLRRVIAAVEELLDLNEDPMKRTPGHGT